ncbi:hypothetical protein [Nocardioides pacificus]
MDTPLLPHAAGSSLGARRADAVLREPVSRQDCARWRTAVLDLTVATRGLRRFPSAVHAGVPGAHEDAFVAPATADLDAALQTDLVVALLDRALLHTPTPGLWLTRPGELALHDEDVAWLTATQSAARECHLALSFVIVTRRGWRDPRSGVRREWLRLRQR